MVKFLDDLRRITGLDQTSQNKVPFIGPVQSSITSPSPKETPFIGPKRTPMKTPDYLSSLYKNTQTSPGIVDNLSKKATSFGIPKPTPLPTSKPASQMKDITFGTVAELPAQFIAPVVNAGWNFLSSSKQLAGGKPLPKLKTKGPLTGDSLLNASSFQEMYDDALASGVSEKKAYSSTLISGILDAVMIASPVKAVTGAGLRKFTPTRLVEREIQNVSRKTLFDYFSGRQSAQQLGLSPKVTNIISEKMGAMNTKQKVEFLKGFDLVSAKPSFLGKMFGVSEKEAAKLAGVANSGTRPASAGALPGYRPVPGQGPAFGLSVRPIEPVGFGSNSVAVSQSIQDSVSGIFTELDTAVKGGQLSETLEGVRTRNKGVFPNFLPDDLKSAANVRAAEDITAGKVPVGKNQKRIYQSMIDFVKNRSSDHVITQEVISNLKKEIDVSDDPFTMKFLDDLIDQAPKPTGKSHLKFSAEGRPLALTARERAIVEKGNTPARLPKSLSGAKPRYNYGSKSYTLKFESDVDKALYIVARQTASKAEAGYLNFLKDIYPDKKVSELKSMGMDVREAIKGQAKAGQGGETLTIQTKNGQTMSGSSSLGTDQTLSESTTSVAPATQSPVPLTESRGNIEGSKVPALNSQESSSYTDSIQDQILSARDAVEKANDFNNILPEPTEFPNQVMIARETIRGSGIDARASKYKDIGKIKENARDIYRNSEQVFGKDFSIIDKEFLAPFDQSKGDLIDFFNMELESVRKNLFGTMKFKPGGKVDHAIRDFGEKKITKETLVERFGQERASQIVEFDSFFRNNYNRLSDEINTVLKDIYPNNPEKWLPKLKNYYKHGVANNNSFSRLQNIFEKPIKIDPLLAGKTADTKPLTKWASFKQRRLGNSNELGALEGYLEYIKSAGYAINIDPHIGKFRGLSEVMAQSTRKTKNLNNYIEGLENWTNILAGKTPGLDRAVNELVGRQALASVNWLNNRVKANTILMNASSSISQIFNVPQGVASAGKVNSIKAIGPSLSEIFIKSPEQAASNFLKERYFKSFDSFDESFLNKPKKFAVWMVTVLDETGTRFIWNGQYQKALEQGLEPMSKEAIRFADTNARKLVAGRGIGEKPLIQESQVFQVVAPFQLEVGNLWWAMEDLNTDNKTMLKKLNAFATLFVSIYLMNSATEEVTGNRVAFDPINAMRDAVGEVVENPDGKGVRNAFGRIAGEVLSNVPFGQSIASAYPKYGADINGVTLPTSKELFGAGDPSRFGSGLLSTKALSDPLYKIALPFGGSQVKKTVGGAQSIKEGQSQTKDELPQFNVGGDFKKNVQALLFGKYSGKQAQKYFDGDSFARQTLDALNSGEAPASEILQLVKKYPTLLDSMADAVQDDSLGITDRDQTLLNLGVSNKARSKEITKQMLKLNTLQERLELFQEYMEKKIITDDVALQLPLSEILEK